ncbi:MAG: hypothetical protein ACHQJ7_05195 [Vicinamibacteria bacterium]
MDFDLENAHLGRGLVRKWAFRIVLLLGAITCFFEPVVAALDRHALSNGVPATIERAGKFAAAPASWTEYEGEPRAVFDVKVRPAGQEAFNTSLFLTREAVERLMKGETVEIVYVKDNPRRHLLKGKPLPPFGWGWILGGFVFLALFIVAMKLR